MKKAYNSYVLIDGRDGRSYLIDMGGNDVHTWPYTGFPVEMIDPAINGGRLGDIICQKEPEIFSCDPSQGGLERKGDLGVGEESSGRKCQAEP